MMQDPVLVSNAANSSMASSSENESSDVSELAPSGPAKPTMTTTESATATATTTATPGLVTPEKSDVQTDLQSDLQDAKSRREAIRARLREREARLTNLVRTTSTDSADSFIGQMRAAKENLEKVETEKSALEQELQKLRAATGGDDFLTEKMSGIQEGFMKQVKTIQKLEDELVAKNNEIEHLSNQLVEKLKTIVELEFDLETHNVHYTEYAAEQFKLGEEALIEIKELEREADAMGDHSERSAASGKSLSPRRAQKLISKLLADLDNLEARYKDEKLSSATQKEKLKLENEELQTRIRTMEARLEEKQKGADKDNDDDDDDDQASVSSTEMINITFLRKRVETLEAKRSLSREEVEKLKKEIQENSEESKIELKRASFEVDRLTLENEAMKTRIQALETDIMDEDPGLNHFAIIEKKIREQYEEIAKLEAASEIKDRQIATLKTEATKLRLKAIGQSAAENHSGFSKSDAELIRNDALRVPKAGNDGEGAQMVDASVLHNLQRQLQSAQQQLVKKDQELVIERAKAASTAAGLLARITELTSSGGGSNSGRSINRDGGNSGSSSRRSLDGSKESTKEKRGKRKGKNAPLRFYL